MAIWSRYSEEQNHVWRLCDIEEDSPYFNVGQYSEADMTKVLHTHDFIQVYYISSGVMKHCMAGNEVLLTKGDMFIIPSGIYHKVERSGNNSVSYISMGFSPKFIELAPDASSFFSKFMDLILLNHTLPSEISLRSKITLDADQQMLVSASIKNMLDELNIKSDGYTTYIKGELLKLLVILARQYAKSPDFIKHIEAIETYSDSAIKSIQYINDNFMHDLKLDEVAKRFLLSRTYFCKLFKKYTNATFNEYLNSLRISHAKSLLISTDLSVSDIAYMSGFNDISNFCRKFKKIIGLAPTAYKKIL